MASEIVMWHIGGGSDELGPIEAIRANSKMPLTIVTFEALEGACVAAGTGEADFYVTKHPLASGLYKGNPRYAGEIYDRTARTWGENTEIAKLIRMKTISADALRSDYARPDVLSIDTQGAELSILQGAAGLLQECLCVVSEVEFAPIYEGQPLFDEQMKLLTPLGFRLMALENPQHWYQGRKFGLGMLTVAEAVWLRFDGVRPEQIERLAMIAACFGRMAYCVDLLSRLENIEHEWLQAVWKFRDAPELVDA